ncbi:MAG: hypothetical protein ACXW6V_26335 [Candidatus Binatia bacterium]
MKALRIESTHVLELERFVDSATIDQHEGKFDPSTFKDPTKMPCAT